MWPRFPLRTRPTLKCPRTTPPGDTAGPRSPSPEGDPARTRHPRAGEADREPGAASRMVRVTILTPGLSVALAALACGVVFRASRPMASPEWGVIARYEGPIRALALSPDGQWVASTGGFVAALTLTDLTGTPRWAAGLGEAAAAQGLAFSPDGRALATGDRAGSVTLWGAASGAVEATLPARARAVTSVAFTPDGTRLAGDDNLGVGTWDVAARRPRGFRDKGAGGPGTLVYSPDGRWLASADAAGSVRLWDAATGDVAARWPGHASGVTSVSFAPGGRRLATVSSRDPEVRIWDVPSGRPVRALRHRGFVPWAVAFSPDGRTVAAAGERGLIVLWEAASGRDLGVLRGHAGWVTAVAFSPDGRRLVSGGNDGTVRLWDPGRSPP